MNRESRPEGGPSRDEVNVGRTVARGADNRETSEGGVSMKSPDGRFAPVTLRGAERVGRGSFWLFFLASCYGWTRPANPDRMLSLRWNPAVGVLVREQARDRLVERAGISRAWWKKAVSAWVAGRMGHRCELGSVFLFLEPLDGEFAVCPNCGERLPPVATSGYPQAPLRLPPVAETAAIHGMQLRMGDRDAGGTGGSGLPGLKEQPAPSDAWWKEVDG